MPRLPYEVDPDTIKRIRNASMLTQREMATFFSVTVPTVQNWERGRAKPLQKHMRELIKMARDSGIGIEHLVKEKEIVQQNLH